MKENVSFEYPEDLFDNLIYLVKHTVTAVPDIFASSGNHLDFIELANKHQYLFRFGNGYGASVVKGPGTYGYDKDLWELAVVRWRGDEWHLDYDTPITADVEGYLSKEEVIELLEEIKNLEGES